MKSIVWDIWLYCNYDCKFCKTKTFAVPEKIRSLYEIEKAWKYIYDKYGKCIVYITGGEPFLYPDFINIINKISVFHDLHITTNLSFDINILKDKAIKNNLSVNATFHPFYQSADEFVSKVIMLKKKEIQISVVYMASDMQIGEAENYKKFFESNKISFSLTDSKCIYSNNNFVSEYIKTGIIVASDKDRKYNMTKFNCKAGVDYACVDINGDVFPCSLTRIKIGNLFDSDVSFLNSYLNCSKECILSENNHY